MIQTDRTVGAVPDAKVSAGFLEALDKKVAEIVLAAVHRMDKNGRKTLFEQDL